MPFLDRITGELSLLWYRKDSDPLLKVFPISENSKPLIADSVVLTIFLLLVLKMYREAVSENKRLEILEHELGILLKSIWKLLLPLIAISHKAIASPPFEQS